MIDYNKLISVFQNHYNGFVKRVPLETLCFSLDLEFTKNNTRQIRRAIHDLRAEGTLIISNSKSSSYWLTTKELIENDPEEKEQVKCMMFETISRIGKLNEIVKPLKKALKVNEQLELDYK